MPAILFFIEIICVLLIVASVPIFFVREMRFFGSRLLLTGLGGYFGSALGYLIVTLPSKFELIDLPRSLDLTIAFTAVFAGLIVGIRVGYHLADRLNRQRGWD